MSSKYAKGRQLLSKKSRAIATVLRKIDEVPMRSELIQYERRFVELYDQVRLEARVNTSSREGSDAVVAQH